MAAWIKMPYFEAMRDMAITLDIVVLSDTSSLMAVLCLWYRQPMLQMPGRRRIRVSQGGDQANNQSWWRLCHFQLCPTQRKPLEVRIFDAMGISGLAFRKARDGRGNRFQRYEDLERGMGIRGPRPKPPPGLRRKKTATQRN